MAQAVNHNEYSYFNPSMRGGLVASGIFHLAIFAATMIGLPFIMKTPTDVSIPISVEIVDIADITTTTKIAKPIEKIDKEDKPPPKISKPSPPEVEETPPEKIEKPPEDIEKPKNELAPPDKAKPKEKVAKPKPKPPVKAEPKKEEPKKDFNSLLKNLTPDTEVQKEQPETLDKVVASATEETNVATLSDRLTMSEMDALRRQLGMCWNVMAGAKFAENLIVEVRVSISPERTVQQAIILDQGRYNSDSYFRAAADAAVRALYNPRCTPLAVPAGKYNEWKTTVITFDPSKML